jgi:copper transport protein
MLWSWPAVALLPALAMAHAMLQRSTPQDGSTLATAPRSISLSFSETAHLTVLTLSGPSVASEHLQPLPKAASRRFTVALPALSPGRYTIDYRVVSTDDGHVSGGAVHFTIAPRG